jgi:hypothetical protein
MELSQLKGKGHVQPSQDNRDHMVKKLENGSSVTCACCQGDIALALALYWNPWLQKNTSKT